MNESLDQLKITFPCTGCGRPIVVPVRWMGRLVRCAHCQTPNRVGRNEPAEEEGELRLPGRVAHEKYMEPMRAGGARTPQLPKAGTGYFRGRWSWAVWLLIAANVIVAAGAVVMIVMKMMGG